MSTALWRINPLTWIAEVVLLAYLFRVIASKHSIFRTGYVMVILGLVMNAWVTTLNAVTMPVMGMPSTFRPAGPIWTAVASDSRLLFLADNVALNYYSLGDVVMRCGLVVLTVCMFNSLRRKYMKTLVALWNREEGQDIAEYAVMLAVILVIVVGTIRLIGGHANNVFTNVASSLN